MVAVSLLHLALPQDKLPSYNVTEEILASCDNIISFYSKQSAIDDVKRKIRHYFVLPNHPGKSMYSTKQLSHETWTEIVKVSSTNCTIVMWVICPFYCYQTDKCFILLIA